MRVLVALIAVLMVSAAAAQMPTTVRKPPALVEEMCTITCPTGYRQEPVCTAKCRSAKSNKVRTIECKMPPSLAKSMPRKMTLAELRQAPAIVCPDDHHDPLSR